jgi:hypothetical protein
MKRKFLLSVFAFNVISSSSMADKLAMPHITDTVTLKPYARYKNGAQIPVAERVPAHIEQRHYAAHLQQVHLQ